MTAYAVGYLTISNTDWQGEYRPRLAEVLQRFEGEVLANAAPERLEGAVVAPDRIVLIRFPSLEKARAWYAAPDHQPLIKLRQTGARFDLFAIEA